LVLAISLDGRLAPADGGAAQIGGPGDRRVLEEALAWADAAMIGAGTLRLHGSTCLIHAADLLAGRRALGRPAQPTAIVVSASGMIDPSLPFFRQPLRRWLLLRAPSSPALPPSAAAFERLLPLDSWSVGLTNLADQGVERLVVLGGTALATSLLSDDRIDQLQLTLVPQLLGGAHLWSRALPGDLRGWRLEDLRRLAGDEVMLLYGRPPLV
jgi:5-amino-6-(5-phosphoribosylamino)uracil reductase